jgi:hypothetical protein
LSSQKKGDNDPKTIGGQITNRTAQAHSTIVRNGKHITQIQKDNIKKNDESHHELQKTTSG